MHFRRWGIIAVAVLVLLGAGTAVYLAQAPSLDELFPERPADLSARIVFPFDTAKAEPGRHIPIDASAWSGDTIATLQLWVDGELAETRSPTSPATAVEERFNWLPRSTGKHLMIVRARNSAGSEAVSELTRVFISGAGAGEQMLVVHTTPGETLDHLARTFGLTNDQLYALNPSLNGTAPDATLPADTAVNVQIPGIPEPGEVLPPTTPLTPTLDPATIAGIAPAVAFEPGAAWLDLQRRLGNSAPPAAPLLQLAVVDCTPRLVITPGSDSSGYFVYRATESQPQFRRIITLEAAAEPRVFEDSAATGVEAFYYVAAFTPGGESSSNIVSTTANTSCGKVAAQSSKFISLVLQPGVAVERAYCYTSLASGPWMRLPSTDFVYPSGGGFDFGPGLSLDAATQAGSLAVECWGWSGSALINLGLGQTDFDPATDTSLNIAGAQFSLTGTIETVDAGTAMIQPLTTGAEFLAAPAPFAVQLTTPTSSTTPTLLWQWEPLGCDASGLCADGDIDGFSVLDSTGKSMAQVADPTARSVPLGAGAASECLSVVAVKDARQSPPSEPLCAAASAPITTAAIAPPGNLRLLNDAADCTQQAPDSSQFWQTTCATNAQHQATGIAWDWASVPCAPTDPACLSGAEIDGFRLYDRYLGHQIAIATTSADQHLAFATPPISGAFLTDRCFSVRAFKGVLESPGSATICADPGAVAATPAVLALPPATFQRITGYHYTSSGDCAAQDYASVQTASIAYPQTFGLTVMQRHRAFPGACDEQVTTWFEGQILLALPQSLVPYQRATLEFQTHSTNLLGVPAGSTSPLKDARTTGTSQSCVLSATASIGSHSQQIDAQSWPGTGRVELDLSALIKAAAADQQGEPLILSVSADQAVYANNDLCSTTLDAMVLNLAVQP